VKSLRQEIIPLLENYLPQTRIEHSIRVAETAHQMAVSGTNLYGQALDPKDAYKAGLLHDIAKALSPKKLCDLGIAQSPWYSSLHTKYPAVWHAFAAPRLIETLLGVQPPEILQAIRYHTTGAGNMGILAKILYIADYIEPERPFQDRQIVMNMVIKNRQSIEDIHLALAIIVSGSIIGLSRRQKAIHPLTLHCYNAISSKLTAPSLSRCKLHIANYY
jgi:predicted HD superfamily hydrolase involved in NAD metabolism